MTLALRVDLFETAWSVIVEQTQNSTKNVIPALVPEVLKQSTTILEKGTAPGDAAADLVKTVVRTALDQCAALLDAEEPQSDRIESLVNILETFGDVVFSDAEVAKVRYLIVVPPCDGLT